MQDKAASLSLAIAPVLVCGCDTSETGDSTLMRQIDHHIVGGAGGNAGRLGDVLDPMPALVRSVQVAPESVEV